MIDRRSQYNSLGFFNLARGLGMLYIIAGHSLTPFIDKSAVDSYQLFSGAGSVFGGGVMVLFFMISGYASFTRSTKKMFTVQAKLLLLPYAVTAAAILVGKGVLAIIRQRPFWTNGGELIPTFLLGLNAEGGASIGGLTVDSVSVFWFILALFGGSLLYNAIRRFKSTRVQLILVVLCSLIGLALCRIGTVWPYCLPIIFLAVGFLALGNAVREYRLLERKMPLWCMGLMLAVIALSFAFGGVNMVACFWKMGLLDVAAVCCIGFLLMWLYARLIGHLPEKDNRLIRFLETVGVYSMQILCLHEFEKMLLPWYRLGDWFPNSTVLGFFICFVARMALILLGLCLLKMVPKGLFRRRRVKISIESDGE